MSLKFYFLKIFLSKTDFWQKIKDLQIVTSSVFSINFDINMWNEINESNIQSYKFLNPKHLLIKTFLIIC